MKINKTLSALCFIPMVVVSLNPLGKQALAGNFSHSCQITGLSQGHVLTANCKDRSANVRGSSIDLNRRIGNRDGRLTKSGNYLATCKNVGLNGTTLHADCLTFKKDYRSTNLDLNRVISNNDGNLTFDR